MTESANTSHSADIPQFTVGETVRLRKAHPCGADTWTVTRVGGDVGLRCTGCARRIFLARRELARRLHPQSRAGAANSA